MLLPVALVVSAYLLGSIPFSYLVVRFIAGADIRQHGSRNVGATNVARTFGKWPGIVALILDMAKGYAAVCVARWITTRPDWPIEASAAGGPLQSREFWIALAALIAVLAHMFPVWLRFHGGKGVATATGAFLAHHRSNVVEIFSMAALEFGEALRVEVEVVESDSIDLLDEWTSFLPSRKRRHKIGGRR